MGIPLGKRAAEAAESVKTAAREASGFVWAILAVAAAALALGAVALVKASRAAA